MNPKNKGKTQPIRSRPIIREHDIYARGFWTVPRRIAERDDLTAQEKLIIGILLGLHMDKTAYNITDGVTPTQHYIAEQLGTKRQRIGESIKKLVEKGLITSEQRGLNLPNVYRLTISQAHQV